MKVDRRFIEGLQLFNEGHYFECHEVIEELWLQTPCEDPYRDLYKGVIQSAAAIYQWDRGVLSGAAGLYRTAMAYLKPFAPEALGLHVQQMMDMMKFYFNPLEGWDRMASVQRPRTGIPVLTYHKLFIGER